MPANPLLPNDDDNEEILLSCRYGELDEIRGYIEKFGAQPMSTVRDENGNTVLHMVCGNGHTELLDYLLPIVPPSLLSQQNNSQSTPLHWAALNSHLAIAKTLVEFPGGPGVDLIDIKNAAGRSPLGEAEQAGWDEGAQWFVQMMKLETSTKEEEETVTTEDASSDALNAENNQL